MIHNLQPYSITPKHTVGYFFLSCQISIIKSMKTIGTMEIIEIPEEGRRYLIHLDKPDINVLKRVKVNKENENLALGKYYINEDYSYARKGI